MIDKFREAYSCDDNPIIVWFSWPQRKGNSSLGENSMTDQELSRQVAEEVMGGYEDITYKMHSTAMGEVFTETLKCWVLEDGTELFMDEWNPLINLNHIFMVVEKMREFGWHYEINDYYGDHEAKFIHWQNPEKDSKVADADLGRAVCMAALKAVRDV